MYSGVRGGVRKLFTILYLPHKTAAERFEMKNFFAKIE